MKQLAHFSALLAIAGFLATAAHAQAPGELDVAFDSTGMVHLGFGFAHDGGEGMVVQPDGKIVVAGFCYNGERREVVVARYNTDGSLDPTFSHDGKVITSVRYSQNPSFVAEDLGVAVALQGDGRIVVAGLSRAGPGGGNDFLVLRYNTDGRLDVNFGVNGYVITDIGGGADEGHALAIQSDGKIVVAGSASVGGDGKYAIVRYDTNGVPDPSFGSGGIVTVGNLLADAAYAVAIQSDDKIVATGFSVDNTGDEKISVLRLDTSGNPDLSFDGDGWAYAETSTEFEGADAVALQPDPPSAERIVVAGSSGGSMIVLRYLPGGAPDTSFDTDGMAFIPNSPIGARDVQVITPDGIATHILVCGSIDVAGQPRFGAARFLLNGTPDSAFDGDGVLTTTIGASAGAVAVLVATDKVLLCGASGATTDVDFTIARYDEAGVLDPTFDSDGMRTDPFGNSPANGRAVAHDPGGKIVIAGNVSEALSSVQRIGVMRLLTNGTPDPSFDGNGTVTTDIGLGNEIVGGVVVQPDGKIVVAGTLVTLDNLNSDIVVLRYLPDGQLDPDFTDDGVQVITLAELDRAQAVALQPDGKIVVAGWTSNYSDTDIALLRFDTNGQLDDTFSGDGIQIMDISAVNDRAIGLTLQEDGKIVIVGEFWKGDLVTGQLEAFIARFEDDGDPDLPFGGAGTAVADPSIGFMGDGAGSVAVQSDGKIVVGGWRLAIDDTQAAVLRLQSNGAPDPGFDGDGLVLVTIGSGGNHANGVAVQSDGSIVMIGAGYDFGPRLDFAVASFKTDGSLNDQFIAPGKVTYDFVLGSGDFGAALSIDSSGRIVLAGQASGLFGVARLKGMQAFVDAPIAGVRNRSRVEIAGANPFLGSTRVAFELARAGTIRLDVYDVAGAHVRTLANSDWPAGRHRIEWDGSDAQGRTTPAGMYFMRLTLDEGNSTAKAVKIR